MVVNLRWTGNTAITTADRVRLFAQFSVGVARRSQVNSWSCCIVTKHVYGRASATDRYNWRAWRPLHEIIRWAALENDASRRSCNQIDIWNINGCLFGWWTVVNSCCCSHRCFDDAVWQFSLAHVYDCAAFLLPCKLFNHTMVVSVVLPTRHHCHRLQWDCGTLCSLRIWSHPFPKCVGHIYAVGLSRDCTIASNQFASYWLRRCNPLQKQRTDTAHRQVTTLRFVGISAKCTFIARNSAIVVIAWKIQ